MKRSFGATRYGASSITTPGSLQRDAAPSMQHYADFSLDSRAPARFTAEQEDELDSLLNTKFQESASHAYEQFVMPPPRFDYAPLPPYESHGLHLAELEPLSARLRPIIRADNYFRQVLLTIRNGDEMTLNELDMKLKISAGIVIQRKTETQLLCAPIVPLKDSDKWAKVLKQQEEDQEMLRLTGQLKDLREDVDDLETNIQIMEDYHRGYLHTDNEEEIYTGILEDHLRFRINLQIIDRNTDRVKILGWDVFWQ